MSLIQLKKVSLNDFSNDDSNDFSLSFRFNLSLFNLKFRDEFEFSQGSSFHLELVKNEDVRYKTLREAFDSCVLEHKKMIELWIIETIPNEEKRFMFSSFMQFFNAAKNEREKLDIIIKNVNKYKDFLDDENALNDYYNENYKNKENYEDSIINLSELKMDIGDRVYLLQDNLRLSLRDQDFNDLFQYSEYEIENIDTMINNSIFLDSKTKSNQIINVSLNVQTKSITNTKYKNINFNINQKNNESHEIDNLSNVDENETVVLRQNISSNYRLFLTKDDMFEYINKLRDGINKSFDEIKKQ